MLIPTRRLDNANFWDSQPLATQTPNGDESLYADLRASYSKGLPHTSLGEVVPAAFNALVNAITTGNQADFNAIPLGSRANGFGPRRGLVNPQNGLGIELIGPDPKHLAIPAAPTFASKEIAAEIAENYWMALARDIHFADYNEDHPIIKEAVADLDRFGADFKGPKDASGRVTPQLLFRGTTLGEEKGPYMSQFLLQRCYLGPQEIDQRMRTVVSGKDYMVDLADWLSVQHGFSQEPDVVDPDLRYIRNGRDLGQWVHVDLLYQAYFNAMLILLNGGARVDAGNPYRVGGPILNEDPFGTLGNPHLQALLPEVARHALRAVWYQKWSVHRRLRPEVFAARLHLQKTGVKDYGIHAAVATDSSALDTVFAQYGTYLLPMGFPEGSPVHPAYGAGHATVAGACVTVLKVWFDVSQKITDLLDPGTRKRLAPVVPSSDGASLVPYQGLDKDDLTVGGELNKLAMNIGIGRNVAGVHWRSDHSASITLGEQVAIGVIRDYIGTFNEPFDQLFLQKFDGSFIKITKDGEQPQP